MRNPHAAVAKEQSGTIYSNISTRNSPALPDRPAFTIDPPCVTFRLVVVSLRGPGQSPVLPFACCVESLLSVGRCGRYSC